LFPVAAGSLLAMAIAVAAALHAWPLPLFASLASAGIGWLAADAAWRANAARSRGAGAALPENVSPAGREIIAGILAVSAHPDAVFRDLLASRLALWSTQMRDWSHGRLVFTDTEAWRTAYERVLSAPEISEYRSVAWLESEHYWQDLPGRKGMQLNFELLDQGVRIERILILGWNVWPPELRLPREGIRRWIEDQHYRGVSVLLLRENDLVAEPDLLRDFGIYGNRAVGDLHIDSESRTVSFELSFETAAVQMAVEQWERLKLFARPYAELIDRPQLR
jgi:hypothetical protein